MLSLVVVDIDGVTLLCLSSLYALPTLALVMKALMNDNWKRPHEGNLKFLVVHGHH